MFVFDSCGGGLKDKSVSKLCVEGMGNWTGRENKDVLLEGGDGGDGGDGADTVSVDVVVVVVVIAACCCYCFPFPLISMVYCLWYSSSISACVK
jgi:hypothetical protein